MTHTKDEALKLALEALEDMHIVDFSLENLAGWNKAVTAIKQALAAPVQEPVAWMTQARNFVHVMEFTEAEAKLYGWIPVYTTPPAQPAPVPPVSQAIIHAITEYGDARADQDANNAPTTSHERLADCIRLIRAAQGSTPTAAQPAVPDAFGTREGEHPQYIQGWNDCRAEMLKGMKP